MNKYERAQLEYEKMMAERAEARKKEVLGLGAKLLVALDETGEVHANSSSVYRQLPFEYLMSTTDMFDVVQKLGELGFDVQRVDSGGQPTWMLA